jgi:hypothetical protein
MHNAPLPPVGSFQERIVSEGILREKNEKFSLVSLFVRLLGTIGNVNEKALDDWLDEYKEELYQLRYNSKYRTTRQRRIMEAVKRAAEEARLMQKVERMTVKDDDGR